MRCASFGPYLDSAVDESGPCKGSNQPGEEEVRDDPLSGFLACLGCSKGDQGSVELAELLGFPHQGENFAAALPPCQIEPLALEILPL